MWVLARRTKRGDAEYSAVESTALTEEAIEAHGHEATYRRLRNLYLSVYALATFGDWIQGGFLYALYAEYGYSMRHIGFIFVIGYASAMTVGTYVSALGDTGGHKRNCILYGVLYAASCMLCNFASLEALLVGRLLGGIAYSILYTSFESWLIAEADARRLPMPLLSRLFSVATFVNAATAVVAGVIGHLAVEIVPHTEHNKFASAFDVGVFALLGASAVAALSWGERFGGDAHTGSAIESLWQSCRAIRRSRSLLCLGLVNSFYEAALYVFVFLWTPALERRALLGGNGPVGHGLVFSIFMLSKMAGSQAFHALSSRLSPASCLQIVFGGSAVCLSLPLLTDSYERTLLCFCGFESLLGIYWPSIALLRCGALDDSQRASTMAVFRVLLNGLVITLLPLAGGLPEAVAFSLAVLMLLACFSLIVVVKAEEEAADAAGSGRWRRHGGGGGGGRDGVRANGAAGGVGGEEEEGIELDAVSEGAGLDAKGGAALQPPHHRPARGDGGLAPSSAAKHSSARDDADETTRLNGDGDGGGDDDLPSVAQRAWDYFAGGAGGRSSSHRGKYSPVTVTATDARRLDGDVGDGSTRSPSEDGDRVGHHQRSH